MLLHVSNNTRPDMAFAVSQAARFTSEPKLSHVSAIMSIVQCLKGTINEGLVFTMNGNCDLTCWVDADFAGLFGGEPSSSPQSAKSRHGHVIEFGGVPLVWKSQLTSETCTSTCHAEHIGLSNALKRLLPIRELVMWLPQNNWICPTKTSALGAKCLRTISQHTLWQLINSCLSELSILQSSITGSGLTFTTRKEIPKDSSTLKNVLLT